MTVWVDADGCPAAVRRIVERAAVRTATPAVFVAAKPLAIATESVLRFVQVAPGEGAADDYIRSEACSGDLAVTADVPLAAALAARGVDIIHPRGDLYSADTIGERLAMRNLLTDLRSRGEETGGRRYRGGPHRFAAALDRELSRRRGRR